MGVGDASSASGLGCFDAVRGGGEATLALAWNWRGMASRYVSRSKRRPTNGSVQLWKSGTGSTV